MNSQPPSQTTAVSNQDSTFLNQASDKDLGRELTALIRQAEKGDLQARERLIRELYPRLRAIARFRLSAGAAPTLLDATALLHESLAKLLDRGFAQIENSKHLVSYAAATMRNVLVDYARERNAQKRDGGERVSLTYVDAGQTDQGLDLLSLDDAMNQLSAIDPRLTAIVELRCFGGLKVEEIAEQLDVSERTVKRDWQKARAFLMMFLGTNAK
ncbi:MAG: ECF-type sigma factor [Casimicrobium sp.]